MKVMTRPTVAALLLLTILAVSTVAQQKRPAPAKPQPKPAAAPTFETLVPAESYTIYGEIRGVGQLIQSSAITEALEPILKLAGPPKEFKTMVKWLNAHAEELTTSRLLVATWPVNKDVPEAIVAIEFASAEEAAKFAAPLNAMLKSVIPPQTEEAPDTQAKTAPVAKPGYYMQQTGSLILLTPKPLMLKKLKPAGSKPLSEDVNFRTARNRFNSEPIFVFLDVKLMERQEEEQRKRLEAQGQESEKLQREQAAAATEEAKKSEEPEDVPGGEDHFTLTEQRRGLALGNEADGSANEGPAFDPVMLALSTFGSSFFEGQSKWPDGVGLALTLENDSFDLRALFVNEAGEKSDTVPFMPMLIPGPPIVSEAANILPADTEVFVTMSLDLAQIYANMSRPRPTPLTYRIQGPNKRPEDVTVESPLAAIEKKLKLNLKDDVIPLLGSEIALRLPATGVGLAGLPMGPSSGLIVSGPPAAGAGPVLLISLKDKEAVRALMPKIVDAMGFKGASSLAQTEKKEDTEVVSYLNFFSYAFVGNFIVLSTDSASVRNVVDSYLKHETLSGEGTYKNFTRWQPRPAHGQVYVSSALMDSYKVWAEQTKFVSEETRTFLMRLTAVTQPITYSLSNEGLGPLHELHLPRNLLLMAVAGISGGVNLTPERQNESMAMGVMMMIPHAEESYKKTSGSYGTLEQLIAAKLISKEMIESAGYKFDIFVTGDKFEAFGVPTEYGKTGKTSFFVDQTYVLRGGDRNGASASSSDPPIQ